MEWVPIIAAIIGTAGIGGAAATATQWTRRARLRSSIEKNTALWKSLPELSAGRAALRIATDREAVTLAALILERPGGLLWSAVYGAAALALYVLAVVVLIPGVITGLSAPPILWTFGLAVAGGMCTGAALQPLANTRHRRDRLAKRLEAVVKDALAERAQYQNDSAAAPEDRAE